MTRDNHVKFTFESTPEVPMAHGRTHLFAPVLQWLETSSCHGHSAAWNGD